MNILYVKLKGFRKYKEPTTFNFDKETYIIGGNAKGKTTIAYAIAWAFLGTDLKGNNKISMINRDSKSCSVEIGFTLNDENIHTLVRYKTESKTLILLDNEKVTQETLKLIYKDVPLFLSIFNPDYFKDSDPAKQKELINKYLPNIPYETVFNALSESEKDKIDIPDGDILKYIDTTKARIKDIEKKIVLKKGEKEYAEKIINEKVEQEKNFEKQKEIDLLEQEKDFLKSESKQQEKELLENEISKIQAELLNVQNKLNKAQEDGRKMKIEYNRILSDPLCTCSSCGQAIQVGAKEIALNNKRKEMFDLADKRDSYQNEVSNLKLQVMTTKMKLYGLGNVNHTNRLNEIEKRLNDLYKEKQDIYDFNKEIELKLKNIEMNKNNIIKIISTIEELDEQKENHELQIIIAKRLYCMMIQEKMKIAEQYMKNTKIQFYELIKSTGELKDAFIITNNGEEFKSLSKSQKFVTVLEICNMLNKISGLNIPILIDDSESYPDYEFKFEDYQSQLIIIKAKRNRKLKVSNFEEKISKPKTIKLRKINKIQELKVA